MRKPFVRNVRVRVPFVRLASPSCRRMVNNIVRPSLDAHFPTSSTPSHGVP